MKGIERKSITGKKLRIGDFVVRNSSTYVGNIIGIVVGFTTLKVAVITTTEYGKYLPTINFNPSIRLGDRYFNKAGKLKKRPVDFPDAKYGSNEFAIVNGQEQDATKEMALNIRNLVKQYNLYPDEENNSKTT